MRLIEGGELREEGRGNLLQMRKPMQRAGAEVRSALREGSSGRVVYVAPAQLQLHRVWAVAEVAAKASGEVAAAAPCPAATVNLAFYRKYTEAPLRRYLRLSMQAGRVPSLMSREVFRGQVTHYKVRGFEEVVIFCHDVEQRLARLSPMDQQLIKRVVLQQYSREETAALLGISRTVCKERYGWAVDKLTAMLLEVGLLDLSKR